MKRLFLCVPVLAMLVFSCVSTKSIVFDESLAPEETAHINYLGGRVDIVEYNGITVEWKGQYGWYGIIIPAGPTRFVFDGTSGGPKAAYYVTYHNVPFEYNFEKGYDYDLNVLGSTIQVRIFDPSSNKKRGEVIGFRMSDEGQTLIER
jgi:hypothetical protein